MAQLGKTMLIGSGAIGTVLRRQGEQAGEPIELLNIRNPDAVRDLHEAYRAAGSQILVTNTFGANRVVLGESGLSSEADDINDTGVRLARQVAGSDCLVWASVGPLSLGLRLDDFTDQELRRVYSEHCKALAGADAIVLETFTDPREAKAALGAASELALPFIFQVGNVGGGTRRWERIGALVSMATAAGATAIGANCLHPNDIVQVAAYLAGRTKLPLTAAPNAGHPEISRGLVKYDFSPEAMKTVGEQLAAAGCAVIGGCCGTTPEHIKLLASALGGKPVARRKESVQVSAEAGKIGLEKGKQAENKIRNLISSKRLVISVEIRADRKRTVEEIVAGAAQIARAGADLFDVPENPGATVGRDAMVVAAHLQEALETPAICHKSVIHANLLQLHSTLIGCWDMGLQGVLVVTGDPPSMGHLAGMAKLVADMKSSVEMLRLIRGMRTGKMINGEEIANSPDFCAGCAVGQPVPQQINWLKKKVEAGAEFAFSQPVFSVDNFRRLRDDVAPLGIRLFPGVMPLTSRKNAELFAGGRIPGIKIPEDLLAKFRKINSPEDQRKFGLDTATELAQIVARESNSIYLLMPFSRNCYSEAAAIVSTIR
jgi:homocysteine S-methyltransferase